LKIVGLLDCQHASILPPFLLAGIPGRLQNYSYISPPPTPTKTTTTTPFNQEGSALSSQPSSYSMSKGWPCSRIFVVLSALLLILETHVVAHMCQNDFYVGFAAGRSVSNFQEGKASACYVTAKHNRPFLSSCCPRLLDQYLLSAISFRPSH